MTPQAYADTIDYLELRWPDSRTYRNADQLYPDFMSLPNEVVAEAASSLYADGRRMAPTISELLNRARELDRLRPGDRDPLMNDCEADNRSHRWAIVSLPSDEKIDAIRRVVCVYCRAERTTTARACPTQSEQGDRRHIPEPRESVIAP